MLAVACGRLRDGLSLRRDAPALNPSDTPPNKKAAHVAMRGFLKFQNRGYEPGVQAW
jgi:hypothetical protein